MADIALGALIALILDDLATTLVQTAERSRAVGLRVDDVDLEIPAHLYLTAGAEPDTPPALRLAMPSSRETAVPGRIGRLRLTIAADALPEAPQP